MSERTNQNGVTHVERLRRLLVFAVWFGVLSGLLQLIALAYQKWGRYTVTHRGAQVVWMAPVAEALVLLLPVMLLFSLGFFSRRAAKPSTAVAVFSFMTCLSLLLLPGWFAAWSAVVLALGVAWQVSRWVQRDLASFERMVRRTLPVFLLLVLTLAAVVNAKLRLAERSALARLPAARGDAPNVILIIWDTVRARSLSLYDYLLQTTPNLDQFARRGVVFERAIATAPWTLPSHASMFTGLYRHEFEAGWAVPLQGDFPTLAEVLGREGYRSGAFVGNLLFADAEHGLARGFTHYQDRSVSLGQILANSTLLRKVANPTKPIGLVIRPRRYIWHKDARTINREFLDWAARDTRRPMFAFLNYFDAHDPYSPPAEFAERFGPIERPGFSRRLQKVLNGKGQWDLSADEARQEQRAYEASILYLDHVLGELLNELQERKLLQNTVVIVTSDHGEEFGEHGSFAHGDNLHMPGLHVPLVVVDGRRVPAGRRVAAPVSLRDLPATVLDLVGSRDARALPGNSWARYWEQGAPSRPESPVLSGTDVDLYGRELSFSLTTAKYHYIRDFRGSEHFFDLLGDPFAGRDVVAAQAKNAELLGMRSIIDRVRECEPPCGPRSDASGLLGRVE